jgi:hypothetical protein
MQPIEDVADHLLIGVKFSNVMAYVLFTAVAEHVQLGTIGPQNLAIRPNPM